MKGRVKTITFQERTMTVRQWASELGVTPEVIYSRLGRGLPLEKVLVPKLRERNRLITFNGMSLTIKEWSRKLGIPTITLRSRLAQKMPLDKVFFQGKMKPGTSHFLTHDGLTLNLTEWSERLGIPFDTLQARVFRGFPVEKVLSVDRLTKDFSGHPKYKVLRRTSEKYDGKYMWEVECPFCGTIFKAAPKFLGTGVQSCGCLRRAARIGIYKEFFGGQDDHTAGHGGE